VARPKGDSPLLTQVELSAYTDLLNKRGQTLRAEAGTAMTLADTLAVLTELRKQSKALAGQQTQLVGRIAKARGRDVADLVNIDVENGGLLVWKVEKDDSGSESVQ